MYLDKAQSLELAKKIVYQRLYESVDFIVAPSMPMLSEIIRIFGDTGIATASQYSSIHKIGAFTSQVSTKMLQELGCAYVIVGHSEVRAEYKETDIDCAVKASLIISDGMVPIICVGEPLEIYQKGDTIQYIDMQLSEYSRDILDNAIIAYEPIWSIGSGLVPTNKEISSVAKFLKDKFVISKVLYGGSVTSSNINQLAKIAEIDGFLIGGASTKISELEQIVEAVS
jgi:triosephosphate isomerase